MISFLVLVTLAGAPPKVPGFDAGEAPSPRELTTLFFLSGDVRRASDFAQMCVRSEGKKCRSLLVAVAEYTALVPSRDTLTRAQAKSYLQWDREVSPKQRGKLTDAVYRRYVEQPLEQAQIATRAGELSTAQDLAAQVLEVDPSNDAAKQLMTQLKLPAHSTKGGSRDGG